MTVAVPNRREFLVRTTSLLGATAVAGWSPFVESASSLAADRKPHVNAAASPIAIVDTHHHLWDLSKFRLPWQANLPADSPIKRSFVMSDYFAATKGLGVTKTVYMEVNVAPEQQQAEADYVLDLCGRDDNPMVAAVLGGSPQDEAFAKYARGLAQSDFVKGFRTVLHDPDRKPGTCLEPTFVANMKLLGELGLRFDLCMRPGEIGDGVTLAKRCPDTRFVIDHCGNMSVTETDAALRSKWMDGMKAAAELDNAVCKISGIVVTAKEGDWQPTDLAPNMNFCLDTFGEDRVFFGGDWPVCTLRSTYARWVEALKWIVRDRPPEFQRKLFHENAVRFYELPA